MASRMSSKITKEIYVMSNSSGSKKIWILSIIAVAVIAIAAVVCTYIFIFRKDYDSSPALDNWKQFSEYGNLLDGGY